MIDTNIKRSKNSSTERKNQMKIYGIFQPTGHYNVFAGHIIVANSEDEIRNIAKDKAAAEGRKIWNTVDVEPHEKVWDLIQQINGQEISVVTWENISQKRRKDLKRKVTIIIGEVINTLNNIPDSRVAQGIELFWIESKRYLNTL